MDGGYRFCPSRALVARTGAGDPAPDSPLSVDSPNSSYEGALEWLEAQRAQYPDLAVTIEEIVADEDTVAAIVIWSGTLAGEDLRFGFPATGVHAEWDSAVFFQMECGKIAASWSLADNLGRLRDSGAITDDEIVSVEAVATPAP